MSKTPTSTISSALSVANGTTKTVASRVRTALTRDGWKVVKASKVNRLTEVLDELYVDSRRQRQVEFLEEARKIVKSL